ncbi:MAG TPA: MBL fold metallo-hydrolase [Bacteroidia bacterium]|nr:MBL fold metallo-hydrolase [Bacteroidia bacterium]
MKVTFLGTGTSQGVPLIGCHCEVCRSTDKRDNRLRSSILVETEQTRLVIDTGPDFRQQMLREGINKLDAVVFTHEHKDHIAGMDEVRAFNYIQKKHMPVYATQRVQKALQREFAYVFSEEKYPGIPEITLIDFEDQPFYVGDIGLDPITVMHYRLPVKGFRIQDFAYITDANFIAEQEKDRLRNLNVLVLNALRKEPHVSHFTLEEAIAMVNELRPRKAYFTHISHQMGLHTQLNADLPAHIEIASDGLQLVI